MLEFQKYKKFNNYRKLKIHAIIIALNEEDFISENIKAIYKYCSGISVISQYDRDYYGNFVTPDSTINKVLNFDDPFGKIHLVIRRYIDETAQRNHEMLSILSDPSRTIEAHAGNINAVRKFHERPDYFWIIDADEIYDSDTIPNIIEYLNKKRPRGMRVSAYEYGLNWNHRVPKDIYLHHHFGFIKAGVFFNQRRVVSWNEQRLKKLFSIIKFSSTIASRIFGFIDCPWEIGHFHHAAYIRRDNDIMLEKMKKHSHIENHDSKYLQKILSQKYELVETSCLPRNIIDGDWPNSFWDSKS
jgi:hypothetical protein